MAQLKSGSTVGGNIIASQNDLLNGVYTCNTTSELVAAFEDTSAYDKYIYITEEDGWLEIDSVISVNFYGQIYIQTPCKFWVTANAGFNSTGTDYYEIFFLKELVFYNSSVYSFTWTETSTAYCVLFIYTWSVTNINFTMDDANVGWYQKYSTISGSGSITFSYLDQGNNFPTYLYDEEYPTLSTELKCGYNTIGFSETNNGNSGTADTIIWTNSNKQKSTLTGNCTYTFTAPSYCCNLLLRVIQDETGGRTVTWPNTVKWAGGVAPTLSTEAGAVDIVSFYFDGTYYYGMAGIGFAVPS